MASLYERMNGLGEVGETDELHDSKQVIWKIPEFSSLSTESGKFHSSKPFSFAGEEFHLRIHPGGESKSSREHVSVYLMKKKSGTDFRVNISLGLLRSDGSVKTAAREFSATFETLGRGHGYRTFLRRNELMRRYSELVPSDILTLVCRMRRGEPLPMESPDSSMALSELEKLSANFKDLLFEEESCDVTLVVKGKEFRAHKSVLVARSAVFAAMFRHDLSEKKTGTVDIQDCDEVSFSTFLEYLYSGKVAGLSYRDAYHLYRTADKYCVPELQSFCSRYMARHLSTKNVIGAAVMADRYDDLELATAAQDFFNGHFDRIVVTEKWQMLLEKDARMASKLMVSTSKYVAALRQMVHGKVREGTIASDIEELVLQPDA